MRRILALGLPAALLAAAPARAGYTASPLVSVYPSSVIGWDGITWTGMADADGVLHFGGDGLVTFDGHAWRTDPAGDSFALRGLAPGTEGRIYAAATGEIGWFGPEAGGRWAYHSLLDQLPSGARDIGEMWSVVATAEGSVAYVGAEAVYWWTGRGFVIDRFPNSRHISACADGGELFVDQPGVGIWSARPGARSLLLPESALDGGVALWLERRADRTLLLATSRGFYAAKGSRCAPVFAPASRFLRQHGLTCARRLNAGLLAIGTLRGGVALIDARGEIQRVFDRRFGLPADEVFSLVTDGEGGLWITSSANIVRVAAESQAVLYRDPEAGGDRSVAAVDDGSGGVYVVGDTGSVALAEPGSAHGLREISGLPRHVYAAASIGGELYVADAAGVSRLAPGRIEPVWGDRSPVFALARGGPESLIAVSDRRLLRVSIRERRAMVLAADLPDEATSLAAAPDGSVWIGLNRSGIRRWTSAGGLELPVWAAQSTRGQGQVASSGNGAVFAFVGNSAWRIDSRTRMAAVVVGMPAQPVATVEGFAAADGAWVVTMGDAERGACLVRIDGRVARPCLVEGLWRIGYPEAVHVAAGLGGAELWVAGSSAVLRLPVPRSAGGEKLPVPTVRLETGEDPAFGFAANFRSYALRPALQLQTRVDGIDREWVPTAPGSVRRFASLREGAYRARARVQSVAGAAGPEASLGWRVSAPWWRRWPALLLGSAAAIAAAFASVRLRLGALQRRNLRLEARIRERTAELERVTAEKARLVAGISHEIRNPLNGIVGLALALEETVLGEEQRKLLDAMTACARHLGGMLEDVIDFARLESGRASVEEEPYAPAAVCNEVAALLLSEARRAGASLTAAADPSVPAHVLGDARRVRQILHNFAHNAVKYAGGPIVVAVRAAGPDRLEFSVDDRGPGIAAFDRARLFEPFVRLGSREPREGHGLGLANARRWAELMGGSVRLDARAGSGCSFRLSLPLREVGSEAPQPLPAVRRVLLVEDEDYSAWATTAAAARIGIAVSARAPSTADALREAEAAAFDLVLLDRRLPDGDGAAVARALRERAQDSSPLIVAVTAAADAASTADCFAAGVDAVVAKPVSPLALREALLEANRFRMLRYLGRDPAGFIAQTERYTEILRQLIADLENAVATAQPDSVRQAAHRLHGHFRMTDFAEGAAAAAALESQPALSADALAAAVQRAVRAADRLATLAAKAAVLRGARGEIHSPAHSASTPACSGDQVCAGG